MKTPVNKGPYYLGDYPTAVECMGHPWRNIMATYSGEFRNPKKGEWYLSGSDPAAYRSPNDLSTSYFIARLVLAKRHQSITITPLTPL